MSFDQREFIGALAANLSPDANPSGGNQIQSNEMVLDDANIRMSYIKFIENINFINAEWGVQISLMTEQNFKTIITKNFAKHKDFVVTFKDVFNEIRLKYNLDGPSLKMVRFLDADNLKIVTKSEYIIFKKDSSRRNFIIQIGKQNIISIGDLGIEDEFKETLIRVQEIVKSGHKYVEYTAELEGYVT